MEIVKISTNFIKLGQFLKLVNLISNGGQAKFFLLDHKIKINEILESKRGKKIYPNDVISVDQQVFQIQAINKE
jgi:S4 domain protein YaaA